jgi:hypothetical protein
MDEMDCFPELKGHYIVMDNAPIHTAKEIDELITKRGYKSIYLPIPQSSIQLSSFGQ